eukprot:12436028-Alexandrium_andersonii.AAC.1
MRRHGSSCGAPLALPLRASRPGAPQRHRRPAAWRRGAPSLRYRLTCARHGHSHRAASQGRQQRQS